MRDPRTPRTVTLIFTILATVVAMGMPTLFGPGSAQAAQASASDLKKQLKSALLQKRMNDATAALRALTDLNSSRAVDIIVDVGLTSDVYDFEKVVGRYLMHLPEGEALDRLCHHATKNKDHRVRIVLVHVLARRDDTPSYTALLTALLDTWDSVVTTALEGVESKNDIGAVPHLVRALKVLEDRGRFDTMVWFETRRTLKALTGKDFPLAADWQNFWAANGATFKPAKDQEKTREITSVKKDPPVFFGTEIVSKKVVFIIDVSGSMEKKDPLPEEAGDTAKKKGAKTVVKGRKKPKKEEKPPQELIPDSRQRLRRVQKELVAVIDRLPKDTKFNIIAYNHEVVSWNKSLVGASDANKQRAIEFVREFKPYGQTSTDLALEAAFDVPGVNTIFLLSDGKPRRQAAIPPEPIADWVKENNRFRRIRVNTVAFEQTAGSFRKFMLRLAKNNFGTYKELR